MFAPTHRTDKHPLAEKLAELDQERDRIRAQLADEDLAQKANAAIHPEAKNRLLEAYARRLQRRLAEKKHGVLVPPGPWDADLDAHPPGSQPEFELADGYKIFFKRNMLCSWNGYITLPDDHPFAKKHYDFFGLDRPEDLPSPPRCLSYSSGSTFGFDHMAFHDAKPGMGHSYLDYGKSNHYNPSIDLERYSSLEDVKAEAEALVDYFRRLATEFKHLA